MDALEKYAPDRIDGVDLGAIEWYHRLRNELYHQGNGLTVERDKVEIYAEIANALFKNLFGHAVVEDPARKTELLGEFLAAWAEFERRLRYLLELEMDKTAEPGRRPLNLLEGVRLAHKQNLFSEREVRAIEDLRGIRNLVAHGQPGWQAMLTQDKVGQLRHWAEQLPSISE